MSSNDSSHRVKANVFLRYDPLQDVCGLNSATEEKNLWRKQSERIWLISRKSVSSPLFIFLSLTQEHKQISDYLSLFCNNLEIDWSCFFFLWQYVQRSCLYGNYKRLVFVCWSGLKWMYYIVHLNAGVCLSTRNCQKGFMTTLQTSDWSLHPQSYKIESYLVLKQGLPNIDLSISEIKDVHLRLPDNCGCWCDTAGRTGTSVSNSSSIFKACVYKYAMLS